MTPRRVVVLGSTGSIGTQALDVVRAHPERFEVVALAAGGNIDLLGDQAAEFGVRRVGVAESDAARSLRSAHPDLEVVDGSRAAAELAADAADLVVNGMTGAVGLEPTLAALAVSTPVALANKESLIVGGSLVTAAADAAGGRETHLIPVDSEHSALAQCLRGGHRSEVGRLVLTASGGPFRGWDRVRLRAVTPELALDHPTWSMGPVITVNSATLMNKGLELIEADVLFDVGFDALDVVVHPQSVVHSMVEFVDGSTLAQLSPPDMRLPIQLAMAWPDRLGHAFVACDWSRATELTFEPVDRATFRALDLAEQAGRRRGTFPCVLNAANEVAVAAFLARRLGFLDIAELVDDVLDAWTTTGQSGSADLEELRAADTWARARAESALTRRSAS